MSPILLILNLAAILFAFILLSALNKSYRIIFAVFASIPIIVSIIIAFLAYDAQSWGWVEIGMLMLRGVLILSIIIGAIACYVATKQKFGK